jgi:hypothetical protein
MITSSEIQNNLKKGLVTTEMLCMVLFSYNKRAKNMRDKEREYRENERLRRIYNHYYYDKYDNEGKAREKKEEYYKKKEELLKYLSPSAIHHVIRERHRKVYDYEKEYTEIPDDNVIRQGSYYDRDEEDYVFFKVVPDKFIEKYLFYEILDYSFHTPLHDDEIQYNIPVVELEDLDTFGKDIHELMSVQMCDKIRLGLQNGILHYVNEEKTKINA